MSRSLNKVMLIGNVGKDPVIKYTPSGIPVTSFRLATSETWKDREGSTQEHTDWHTVVAWRGLAEVVARLVFKGSRVYIEGKLQSRTFDDQFGNKKFVVEILADSLLLLDGRKRDNTDYQSNDGSSNNEDSFDTFNSDDDDFLKDYESIGHPNNIPF